MYHLKSEVTNEKTSVKAQFFLISYLIAVSLFSMLLFLYGFLPGEYIRNESSAVNDIPTHVEQFRIQREKLYRPVAQKLVVMVIDAFRWDFLANVDFKDDMPNTHKNIDNNNACAFQTSVHSPTVTMPRIKSITSGTIPGYLDVIYNFGSKTFDHDNIIRQARKHKKKIVFYGDDTWLDLFPKSFDRFEGTTSFFVTDFTEVDHNVTRNLKKELENNDWSIMILHYLGLDHIGHVEGPFSPLIKTKLFEMDEIIAMIQKQILAWKKSNISGVLMVCGDHGMKNSGGHGGSSLEETQVPVIFFGTDCKSKVENPLKISQIDIAPTLSVLMGIPIPQDNLGTMSSEMLQLLPVSNRLFVLYYNAKQLFEHYKKIPNYEGTKAFTNYKTAKKLHEAWIVTKGQNEDIVQEITEFYVNAIESMKQTLSTNKSKCEIDISTVAVLFFIHAICLVFTRHSTTHMSSNNVCIIYFCYTTVYLVLKTLFAINEPTSVKLVMFAIAVITCLHYFLNRFFNFGFRSSLSLQKVIKQLQNLDPIGYVFYLGTALYIISLGASSFIDEEHLIWYFLWPTLIFTILFNNFQRSNLLNRRKQFLHSFFNFMFILVVHRIFQKFKSTGFKYIHLADIVTWLNNETSKVPMTLLLVTGIVLLIIIGYESEKMKPKKYSILIYFLLGSCIYTRHSKNGDVISPPVLSANWVQSETNLFWAVLSIDLILDTILIIKSALTNKRKQLRCFIMHCILKIWIMVTALLHRPYNLILLPTQIIISCMLNKSVENTNHNTYIVQLYSWLGYVFYFYQGNSNNLATVDVAAGYIGMKSYNFIITGVFLLINTFSGLITSYLLLLNTLVQSSEFSLPKMASVNILYIVWRLFPLTFYLIFFCWHRHHLFIWSVFFPKLLYEILYSSFLFCVIGILTIILKITS